MHERVKLEIDLVRGKYPQVEHGDDLSWVHILDFHLSPGRFNKGATRLAFLVPPGYPQTGPDDFFVDDDLRLQGGGSPPGFNQGAKSSSGTCPLPGNWGWFSWHPKNTVWRPASTVEGGDNLLTFVRSVVLCLQGREES
jgi:hypothetical protein